MKNVIVSSLIVLTSLQLSAAILNIDLRGKAGDGLLPGNENHVVSTGGTGGEIGAGITFDDVTNILSVNVGWGTANGFTNLTGNATAGHIHGPTASSGTASFTQNAGVLIGFATFTTSASSGSVSQNLNLNATQVQNLLDGRLYINIHTATNGSGEIRGNLVVVPEPSAAGLFALVALVAARRR